jgi:hypothetical protein
MHRWREWDAIATLEAPGAAGDTSWLVVLPGGRLLVEEGTAFLEAPALASALRLEPPFRARAVRGERHWRVGATSLEVVELKDDPRGNGVELAWDGTERSVRLDGEPTLGNVPELERLGASRHDAYVVTAQRLDGSLWEVVVNPL